LEKTSNPKHGMLSFDAWITKAMWDHRHAHDAFDDLNIVALSIPPCTKAKRYTKIKIYGNDFRVDASSTTGHVTHDSGVVFIFSHGDDPNNVRPLGQLQYVGVLKDILELDYGIISTHVVLF
jgi:hypothetical protein